jgi:hypothetical protein
MILQSDYQKARAKSRINKKYYRVTMVDWIMSRLSFDGNQKYCNSMAMRVKSKCNSWYSNSIKTSNSLALRIKNRMNNSIRMKMFKQSKFYRRYLAMEN